MTGEEGWGGGGRGLGGKCPVIIGRWQMLCVPWGPSFDGFFFFLTFYSFFKEPYSIAPPWYRFFFKLYLVFVGFCCYDFDSNIQSSRYKSIIMNRCHNLAIALFFIEFYLSFSEFIECDSVFTVWLLGFIGLKVREQLAALRHFFMCGGGGD